MLRQSGRMAGVLLACATLAAEDLALQVSAETTPPGGMTQIKIETERPRAITRGRLTVDFDPAVFGDVEHVAVFSAAGDAYGSAIVHGRRVELQFASPSGGIGRLPRLPVAVVNVPILASAVRGAKSRPTVNPGSVRWSGIEGAEYSIRVRSGELTVDGGLSVTNVTPGGGDLPRGTPVRVEGAGFTASTTVDVEGAAISSVRFISPQEMELTLAGPVDLTGKRIRIRNSGAQIDYFPSLRGLVALPANDTLARTIPILPLRRYEAGQVTSPGIFASAVVLQNPTLSPVDVSVRAFVPLRSTLSRATITIPAGGLHFEQMPRLLRAVQAAVQPSAPIRMLGLTALGTEGPLEATLVRPSQIAPPQLDPVPPLSWTWQTGTAPPSPRILQVTLPVSASEPLEFTVANSGEEWLSITPRAGTSCERFGECPDSSRLSVAVDPAGLAPGVYTATITLTPTAENAIPTAVDVILNVTREPLINASTQRLQIFIPAGAPATQTIDLETSSGIAAFSASATTDTFESGWLAVTPTAGTAPGTLTVTTNPAGVTRGTRTGRITIVGPINTLTISVEFTVENAPDRLYPSPESLLFSIRAGSQAAAQKLSIASYIRTFEFSVATQSGGDWLKASAEGPSSLRVTADASMLVPGRYEGEITLSAPTAIRPERVPVSLVVWSEPPALSVSPARLAFTVSDSGASPPSQSLMIHSGAPAQISVASPPDLWLRLQPSLPEQLATPMTIVVGVTLGAVPPAAGVHESSITITGSGGQVVVPVTLAVVTSPPLIGSIVSGASQVRGKLAPGEIVALHGAGLGAHPVGLALESGRVATRLAGTHVFFDGVAAPVLYASATQINTVVPYEVAGKDQVTIKAEYGNTKSQPEGVAVAAAAPAVFTIEGSGRGQAAVLNQDNSVNSPANAAASGSVIQIFATGEGLTEPPTSTGEVTGNISKRPVLPVRVTIGGFGAQVLHAGSAPNAVGGLLQVNAVVPSGVPPSAAVPLVISIGEFQGQDYVTIAVK
ncbi:MAG: hypothetical protein HYZ57_11335 [Acidobacteria bacterium]|nr:hypothetical protein [Acidobacteriota bacterium]